MNMEPKDYIYMAAVLLSIWNAYNLYKTNKKTSFINTVTSERVKWLEKLRINISAFCGLTHTWTRSNPDFPGTVEGIKILGEIDNLRYLIRLQLNPKTENKMPNPDKIIEDLIARIPDLTDGSKRAELNAAINELIETSQALLKIEWEKVKSEAKNGDLSDAQANHSIWCRLFCCAAKPGH